MIEVDVNGNGDKLIITTCPKTGKPLYELSSGRPHVKKRGRLSWQKAQEIRSLAETGKWSNKAIAERFGVTRDSICRIVNNRAWIVEQDQGETNAADLRMYTVPDVFSEDEMSG